MPNDKIALDFHDTLLHESDLKLLDEGGWLNDTIIGFYLEYMEKILYTDQSDIAFLSPSFVQLLKTMPSEEVALICEPLDLKRKKIIFLPLNDSTSTDSPGGSHWSLLVYRKEMDKLLHYDSMRFNMEHAKIISGKLAAYFGSKPPVLEPESPKQSNSYDCGVHVICNLDYLCNMWIKNDSKEINIRKYDLEPKEKRREITGLILSLQQ